MMQRKFQLDPLQKEALAVQFSSQLTLARLERETLRLQSQQKDITFLRKFTLRAMQSTRGNISRKRNDSKLFLYFRFAVSFVPAEACEHIINVSFNKMPVPGCPINVQVSGNASGPQVSLTGPGPVHQPNSLIINHSNGRLDDIEVNVEGNIGFFM